jgi:hypothetical protein
LPYNFSKCTTQLIELEHHLNVVICQRVEPELTNWKERYQILPVFWIRWTFSSICSSIGYDRHSVVQKVLIDPMVTYCLNKSKLHLVLSWAIHHRATTLHLIYAPQFPNCNLSTAYMWLHSSTGSVFILYVHYFLSAYNDFLYCFSANSASIAVLWRSN